MRCEASRGSFHDIPALRKGHLDRPLARVFGLVRSQLDNGATIRYCWLSFAENQVTTGQSFAAARR